MTKTTGCNVRGEFPDAACTPGGVLASATPASICVAGYTKTVRNVLPSTKDAVFAAYGIAPRQGRRYEIDHLVALELGGNNARANLWPQIAPGYGEKDTVENELHAAVCAGRIGLKAAQVRIARNWRQVGVSVPSPASVPARPVTRSTPTSPPAPTGGGDAGFCSSHTCIPNFDNGKGTIVQCSDGQWSHSGGRPGVCNRHGGPK